MDPPPYTLSRDSSVRPQRRVKFVDGEQTYIHTINNDIIQAYQAKLDENDLHQEPVLRRTSESQTFHFYGTSEVDDDFGQGEVRIQSFPIRPSSAVSIDSTLTSSTLLTDAAPNSRASLQQSARRSPHPPPPYKYPDGYVCLKCRNTGLKSNNREPCPRCFRMFSTQTVKYSNPIVNAVSLLTRRKAKWVDFGDGTCSMCLGTGRRKRYPMFSNTCSLCEGNGRWP